MMTNVGQDDLGIDWIFRSLSFGNLIFFFIKNYKAHE